MNGLCPRHFRRAFLTALALSCAFNAKVANTQAVSAARFPFVMPWNDASKTVTDVSFLNPAPLTNARRIGVRNGHFYDTMGRRVRFLGTNFVAGANFLSKADAAAVAARMHKLGFNIVRLHHMDATWAQPSIFGANRDAANLPNEILAPSSLNALDYLVAQFKKNGIYVDLNLHVAWSPTAAGGYPDTDQLPDSNKGVSYFEKRAIEHQRHYARQFLTHLNPYTGLTWANDPTIALIEITNEDTLLGQAWNGSILNYPPYYLNQLQARWNTYLLKKYGSTQSLKTAWQGPGLGPNILQNNQFASGLDNWSNEKQAGDYSTTVEPISSTGNTPSPNGQTVHFSIRSIGDADWKQQFHYNGLNLPNGAIYTIRFWAKADKARPLAAYIGRDEAPWGELSPAANFNLSTDWKRYELTATLKNPIPNHSRLSFAIGGATGELWIADVSLQRGASSDIGAQRLEDGSVQMALIDNSLRGRDMVDFLMGVERDFSVGMYNYLKQDLGAKSLVTCSQSWLGGLGGVVRESRMDWIDHHAYWQHPQYPGAMWDPNNWLIGNTAMVSDANGGTLPFLAAHRVEGKPFTVTEYNHPAPSDYASETLPFMAAYAAAQDWDGFFLFDYHSEQENWDRNKIVNFFDVDADPNKMANMPAAALMFLGQGVPVNNSISTLTVPRDAVVSTLASDKPGNFWDSDVLRRWTNAGWTLNDLLSTRMNLRLTDGNGAISLNRVLDANRKNVLAWNNATPQKALFKVDAPNVKSIVGFLGGQSATLSGFTVSMSPTTRNFATVSLNSKDGKPIGVSSSLLLTALSNVENQNVGWNAARNSVGSNWGTGPTMAEGVPAQISLRTSAKTATVYALDNRGARTVVVPSQIKNGQLQFAIGAQYQTLWYEIAAR